MKTIEERAKEWGEHIVENTPYDVVNGKVCVFVEDRDIANVAEESYIAGATEQKAIDEANRKQGYHDAIEKACEWLGPHLAEVADRYDSTASLLLRHVKENFRIAMEKEL